jgi:hypothetical protein
MSRTERALLIFILIAYTVVAALYAARTPAWQAPDEPAHYNYVAQIATAGCCPLLEVGDWDGAYLDELKSARFQPDLLADLDSIQYEDHQAPLYYLIAAQVFRITNGDLTALRLLNVVIGAGVVLCAYGVGKAILPHRPQIALGAAALAAFIPQHTAVLASVTNDALAELVIGATLLALILYLKGTDERFLYGVGWAILLVAIVLLMLQITQPHETAITVLLLALIFLSLGGIVALGAALRLNDELGLGALDGSAWMLGLLVGVGLIAKLSTAFLAGLVPLTILLFWWTATGRKFRRLIGAWIAFAVPALIVGGIWWIRNLTVYGVPDFLGLARHDLVVADQARTADLIAQVGIGETLRRGFETTYNSFWGQFGWMGLPLPSWTYTLIAIFLAVALVGALIGWLRARGIEAPETWRRISWLILALAALLGVVQYVFYNSEFVQFQGRYLYPALIPTAIGIALGLDGWRYAIRGESPHSLLRWTPVVAALLFLPLSLYLVWRVIPLLAP